MFDAEFIREAQQPKPTIITEIGERFIVAVRHRSFENGERVLFDFNFIEFWSDVEIPKLFFNNRFMSLEKNGKVYAKR